MSLPHRLLGFLAMFAAGAFAHAALGEKGLVEFTASPGNLTLVQSNTAAPLVVDAQDWPGVIRAAGDLQADIQRVTGQSPVLHRSGSRPDLPHAAIAVFIGTLGHSPLIDALARTGKLDTRGIGGHWESFVIQTVAAPLPGIERAVVIAGSDKRGTIYGIYDVSEQIGVSPWYWWADVTPEHHDALFIRPGRQVVGEPSVKYRGIFLNDEAPDLTNWVRAKFGTVPVRADPPVPAGIANYGHEFYARIFEVLLRLRGNYLWPAMWNNAFNEDDLANAQLADEYGIVMGTSHQEPMLRAQKEWDRRYLRTLGTWNYAKNPEVLENFWRDGVRRNKDLESIVTIGLRGANDTPMAPGGPEANRELLEKIVATQRKILAEEINPDVTRVPQAWCLYKEVQDFYEAGMRAPDDVTLLWAEDNWGNVRRLPTAAERHRPGGAGIYYHFDYHGGPRSYQWLNTNPLPKIWDQMSLAKQYGADRIWIVNVGHFKGYELPTEYFLRLAWDTNRWTNDNVGEFTRLWAVREFGAAHAPEIADIVEKYTKYNGRRKPELLAPHTYSLTNYREAETVMADFDELAKRAQQISVTLPPPKRDAFYELVLFPTQASATINDLYLAAGKNALYAQQGRASANNWATATKAAFQSFQAQVDHYNNALAGGKWDHFMDQPVLGYTSWRDPPKNTIANLKLVEIELPAAPALGVAVEGTTRVAPEPPPPTHAEGGSAATPGLAAPLRLPRFDSLSRERHYVEIFNRGKTPFDFGITTSARWIKVGQSAGAVGPDCRIWITIDWERAPKGHLDAELKITGAGETVTVVVDAQNLITPTRQSLRGFAESDGVVSIEPEHFTANNDAGLRRWIRVEDYGRTLSGMRADGPIDSPSATPGKDAPYLEYRMYLFAGGVAEVTAITSPTLNFVPDRGLQYAVSFDDAPPQIMTLVPRGYRAQNGNRDWETTVADNARYSTSTHTLAAPGYHTLKIWMIDPGVVLQKIVVNLGGLKPSYLGPPESLHGM